MPALQVRDFPDDLYEQLKAYAASQHRSIAQQTIVAVEQMLEAADAQHYWDGHDLHRLERRPRYFDFDTEAKRAARIEKRKELFAEIDKLPKFDVPDDFPDTNGKREYENTRTTMTFEPSASSWSTPPTPANAATRSEEHTSELQSQR